ncbi:MAG: hypothetical protein ABIY70_06945 [Capsulimonas sp.]|uniref:hypothetical protein n=1 Tax=Capsulimonas sp. TaxID=2494211 RepID=UPI0032668F65
MQTLIGALGILGKLLGRLIAVMTVGPPGLMSLPAEPKTPPMSVEEIVREAQRRDELAASKDASEK